MFCQSIAQLSCRLRQRVQRVTEILQCPVGGMQGVTRRGQAQILGVTGQGLAHRIPLGCCVLELDFSLVEPPCGALELPRARCGFEVRAAQGFVGGCALPLGASLVLVLRALRIGLLQRGQTEGQRIQAIGNGFEASRACLGPRRVADEFGAGLVPDACERAEAESAIRTDPGVRQAAVLRGARDASQQALHHVRWHCCILGGDQRRRQPGAQGLRLHRPLEPLRILGQW